MIIFHRILHKEKKIQYVFSQYNNYSIKLVSSHGFTREFEAPSLIAFNISFIPFNIRKAFKLNTIDFMDKVYSYLFYRVVQRAKNITFIHNTNSDFNSKGEISRFIKQINLESKYKVREISVSDEIGIVNKSKLVIPKSKKILEKLRNRFFKEGYISPSGVKDYMDCSLRFYYKYVANIKQLTPFSENIEKPEFGKIAHSALEIIYRDLLKNKKGGIPSVGIPATVPKIKVKIPELNKGCIIYQKTPKIVCL